MIIFLTFVLQSMCRPIFCPIGEVFGGCKCISFIDQITDMVVLLKLKVKPTVGNSLPTTDADILKLGVALQRAIKQAYVNITAQTIATFQHESTTKPYNVFIASANTIKNYDIKESFRSLAQRLDGPPFLQISQDKQKYDIELSNHVGVWFDSIQDTNKSYNVIRARDLTTQRELTRIYQNDKAVKEIKKYGFQELSPLLYCKLVEVKEDEYKEENGTVTLMALNGSLEIRSTPNYYHVTTNHIRVCVSEYIRPEVTSSTGEIMNCVQLLIIQMSEVCMLLGIWSLY